eukprot:TRINITY_DN15581_c0_g1_i1.p1 TRINITY_DN15581_c0_g1~~TRINITY_DN15581_c0_g1_i1.p1  ORF type:complete len:447 (+),score=116.15 TRINITY_DN15581_c0_g1_i1:875-2215(+)
MKKVLIIGSNGWLASRLASMLKERKGDKIVIRGFDIMPCKEGVKVDEFVRGDLTSKADVTQAMVGIDTVFHVAAIVMGPPSLLHRVNVLGVENSLTCAQEAGVKSFIYTSTASVVYNGVDLHNATEDLPYTTSDLDAYTITKAKAEGLVLSKNGQKGIYTCALRPHSIYGPGDDISWPQMLASAHGGKLKWKLTENVHKSSYTFLDNIVHSEILAADILANPAKRDTIGGKAYNINDDIEALFWTKTYDVGELSGVPRSTYGKLSLPFFGLIYYISWFFWAIGYPLGTFTPYVLSLATTTHTYSCARAKKELGYAPLMPHEQSWKITAESFKNWKNTYKPKPTPKLTQWLTLVSVASILKGVVVFLGGYDRRYGALLIALSLFHFAAGRELQNQGLFRATRASFFIILAFYVLDLVVFGTTSFLGALPGLVGSIVSIVLMNQHLNQ